jgi:hypothetical protein
MQERGRMTIREMGVRSGGMQERAVWAGIQSVKGKIKKDLRLKKAYESILNN